MKYLQKQCFLWSIVVFHHKSLVLLYAQLPQIVHTTVYSVHLKIKHNKQLQVSFDTGSGEFTFNQQNHHIKHTLNIIPEIRTLNCNSLTNK